MSVTMDIWNSVEIPWIELIVGEEPLRERLRDKCLEQLDGQNRQHHEKDTL